LLKVTPKYQARSGLKFFNSLLALFFLPAFLPVFSYGLQLKLDSGYTSDVYRDGERSEKSAFLFPEARVRFENINTERGYGLYLQFYGNGRIFLSESRAHEVTSGGSMESVHVMGNASELSHELAYDFSNQNLDSVDKVKAHSVGVYNRARFLGESSDHSFRVPVTIKIFSDTTTGGATDVTNVFRAQEADFRDSHLLTGFQYEWAHRIQKKLTLKVEPSIDYRHYFERKARATDGGVLQEAGDSLDELRLKARIASEWDGRRFESKGGFLGGYNLDLVNKAEDYYDLNPFVETSLRLTRRLKLSSQAQYTFRQYFNKLQDSFSLSGSKLNTHQVLVGGLAVYRVSKAASIKAFVDWERHDSNESTGGFNTDYTAITTGIGFNLNI